MNIAIIGGSGFVGTQLISLLQQSRELHVKNIDKQHSKTHSGITTIANVLDAEALKGELAGFEVVILLAAEHRDDVTPTSLYYDVNVQGMRNTLAAMEH